MMKHNRSRHSLRRLAVVFCALLIIFSAFASAQAQFHFDFTQSGSQNSSASNGSPQPGANTVRPSLPTVVPYQNPTAAPRVNNSAGAQFPKVMYIVNCKDWVSLRATPSTTAAVLCQVPFGSSVTVHSFDTNIYAHCSYQGMNGYIMIQYLGDSPSSERASYSTPGVKGNAEQTMQYSGFWTIYPDYEPFNGSNFGTASPSTVMGEYLFRVGSHRYQVYKCESFVSLREEANSYSDCIIEVPKPRKRIVMGSDRPLSPR